MTSDVAAFLAGTPNYGWIVRKDDESATGQVDYFSKEGSNPPQLVLTVAGNVSVSVSVTPSSASLSVTQTQQFSANVTGTGNTAVNWSVTPSVGAISAAGLYTTPTAISAQQAVTVTATSAAAPSKSASATVTLVPVSIGLTPGTVTLNANGSHQFTASVAGSSNTAATWSMSPSAGTLSQAGLYTAPSPLTITATSVADPTKSASATVTLQEAWQRVGS